jgi:hypothetical protein
MDDGCKRTVSRPILQPRADIRQLPALPRPSICGIRERSFLQEGDSSRPSRRCRVSVLAGQHRRVSKRREVRAGRKRRRFAARQDAIRVFSGRHAVRRIVSGAHGTPPTPPPAARSLRPALPRCLRCRRSGTRHGLPCAIRRAQDRWSRWGQFYRSRIRCRRWRVQSASVTRRWRACLGGDDGMPPEKIHMASCRASDRLRFRRVHGCHLAGFGRPWADGGPISSRRAGDFIGFVRGISVAFRRFRADVIRHPPKPIRSGSSVIHPPLRADPSPRHAMRTASGGCGILSQNRWMTTSPIRNPPRVRGVREIGSRR